MRVQYAHRLPFGKYRNRELTDPEIPADYLLWFLRTCDPSTGLRAALRQELRARGVKKADLPPDPGPPPRPARCRRCGPTRLRLR
jgi:uncharacterized protein (DUF3820 family)